jgi:hypothetical protein
MAKQITLWVGTAVALLVLGAMRGAQADSTFFAEDLNFGGDTVRINPVNSLAKRNEFTSLLVGITTDNLETQTPGAAGPWSLAFGTLSGTGPNTGMVSVPTGTDGGRFPTSGNIYFRQADEFEPNRYLATLTLATPQRAFGFLATDWGDSGFLQGTRPTVTVTFLDNTISTFEVPASILGTDMTGSVAFFGLITDAPFKQVEIVNGTGSRTTGYDDFIVAPSAVAPEPGTLALLGFGGIALAGIRLRRKVA